MSKGTTVLSRKSEKEVVRKAGKLCLKKIKAIKVSDKEPEDLAESIESKGYVIESRAKWELTQSAESEQDFKTDSEDFVPGVFSAEHLGLEKGLLLEQSKKLGLEPLSCRDILEFVNQYDQPIGECLIIPVRDQDAAFVLKHDARGDKVLDYQPRSSDMCGGVCKTVMKLPTSS